MIAEQSQGFYTMPPLWKGKLLDVAQFDFPEIDIATFSPEAIPYNIRLGHQVEYIFKQLIEYSNDYELILYNLPISANKITLGEIDFILLDKRRNRYIHIELTYKFYVIDTSFEKPINQLIGPNRKDSFYQKITKIRDKQFPLLHRIEAKEALDSLGININELAHYSCFKAQLFRPFDQQIDDLGVFNRDCLVGVWLRLSDLLGEKFQGAKYYLPSKSEWLLAPHHLVAWQSYDQILTELDSRLARQHSPMLWIHLADDTVAKVFLVWW